MSVQHAIAPRGELGSLPRVPEPAELASAREIVAGLFGDPAMRPFAVRYWNGAEERGCHVDPPFTIVLNRPGALTRMFLPPSELALGEAFVRGDFDVEGSLEAAAGLPRILAQQPRSWRRVARLARLLRRLPARDDTAGSIAAERRKPDSALSRRHSRRRDAAAIRFHYDVGNDFYALWLDSERVYSCGYFPTGTEDLDAAQIAKLDHICRKLRLRPGERLLDIGCGWGGLIRYAARQYGVEALGITLSPAQAAYANGRIIADGLRSRCRVEVRDYRDLSGAGVFDKVVSVGMFEHVGPDQLGTYFAAAFRATRPGGLFLNHGIVSLEAARPHTPAERLARGVVRQGEFIDRYVFPDGELVPLAYAIQRAEGAGFETRDVESLREHYARTLRHWVRRLEASEDQATRLVGEPTYRVWRLYMAASAHAFTAGRIGIAQVLLARPDENGSCDLPATRADIHSARPAGRSADRGAHRRVEPSPRATDQRMKEP